MNYYNENDKFAAAWLEELIKAELIPAGHVDTRSIKDVAPPDLKGFTQCHFFAGIAGWSYALELAGWPADRPVWTGSCPCQPFSSAGKQRGADDERHLWPVFYGLIRECKPAIVFGEQAPKVEWMDAACGDLERAGYAVRPEILRADSVGADHERRRFYWVASNATGQRQPQPWEHWQNTCDHQANEFREADRLVDAFRREAMPFLCGQHDGIPAKLGEGALSGYGNAIVPQVAAEFICAYCGVGEGEEVGGE